MLYLQHTNIKIQDIRQTYIFHLLQINLKNSKITSYYK